MKHFALIFLFWTVLVSISAPFALAQQETVILDALSKDVAEINKKVDQITQSQQEILNRLQDIREELDVVRVRARRG